MIKNLEKNVGEPQKPQEAELENFSKLLMHEQSALYINTIKPLQWAFIIKNLY